MPSSPGQRLRREQGLRCMTSFPLCALVRVFCVRPYSTAVCGTGCERSATFRSTKRHPRLLNGSFFPLRGLTRRAFLLQKGGGAQKKAGFFRVFTAAAICGAHIGSMTGKRTLLLLGGVRRATGLYVKGLDDSSSSPVVKVLAVRRESPTPAGQPSAHGLASQISHTTGAAAFAEARIPGQSPTQPDATNCSHV